MSFSATGKAVRLRQLENPATRKSVTIALDHGLHGVPEGFAIPRAVIGSAVAARPDALLLTAGMAAAHREMLVESNLPLLISVDFCAWDRSVSRVVGMRLGPSLETAIQVGGHGVKTLLLMDMSAEETGANLQYIAALADQCERYGLPLMVEPVAWNTEKDDPERAGRVVLDGCRIAVELGADLLKVGAVGGNSQMLVEAVRMSPVPVTVLGGARRDPAALLAEVTAAAQAGAWGAVVGRNVWQNVDPSGVVRSLSAALNVGRTTTAAG